MRILELKEVELRRGEVINEYSAAKSKLACQRIWRCYSLPVIYILGLLVRINSDRKLRLVPDPVLCEKYFTVHRFVQRTKLTEDLVFLFRIDDGR